MTKTIRLTLLCVAVAAARPAPAPAQDPASLAAKAPVFYGGPVQVRAVRALIDLDATAAPALVAQLAAPAAGATMAIGGAAPVRLEAADRVQAVTLPLAVRRTGKAGRVQDVSLDLRLLIDGAPIAAPLTEVDVTMVLPRGVPAILRSNQPVTQGTTADGRTTYRLAKAQYLTTWRVAFATGPVTLQMEKRLDPATITDPRVPVVVSLRVRNLGTGEARDVRLSDDLDPRDFAGDGKGFEPYAGKANDRRLLWRGRIERLAPGEEITVRYQVTALHPVHSVSLPAASATIAGDLVGLSNKVVLPPGR